jgi:hypothetical protein
VQARSHRLGGATSSGLFGGDADGSLMSEFVVDRMIGLGR